MSASRALPSFCFGFIALIPTLLQKLVGSHSRKICKTQSLTQSLATEGGSDFAIYTLKYIYFILFLYNHMQQFRKADIRNPLSLLAHERSRFATCQWELLTPTEISIPLTHRLVLYALEAGECLFCVQKVKS